MNEYGGEKKFDAIVCLSAIDWDFLWQRTQEIMSQFASMGYPVLFVENTGVRVPTITDLPRVVKRLKKISTISKSGSRAKNSNNVTVLSPLALPFPYMSGAVKINCALIKNKILKWSKDNNLRIERVLLWSYMTTPLAVELSKSISWAGVVVDLVSDPCKVPGAEKILDSHKTMLKLADQVCCASMPILNVAKEQTNEKLHYKLQLFEDGFSTRLIDLVEKENFDGKLSVFDKGRPVAVYIGGINNKIWWDAVDAMAAELPEMNFVFVGPRDGGELPSEGVNNNFFWYPPFEKYSQLGCFLQKCSVGLIPYVPSPYVMEMRPAKINEYLVMGLPIVGTGMPELMRIDEQYGPGVVYLANKPDDFAEKIRQALNENSRALFRKRREITFKQSWERVCKEIDGYLHKKLRGW